MEDAVRDLLRWVDLQEDVGKWALETRYALNRVRACLAVGDHAAPCGVAEEKEVPWRG